MERRSVASLMSEKQGGRSSSGITFEGRGGGAGGGVVISGGDGGYVVVNMASISVGRVEVSGQSSVLSPAFSPRCFGVESSLILNPSDSRQYQSPPTRPRGTHELSPPHPSRQQRAAETPILPRSELSPLHPCSCRASSCAMPAGGRDGMSSCERAGGRVVRVPVRSGPHPP